MVDRKVGGHENHTLKGSGIIWFFAKKNGFISLGNTAFIKKADNENRNNR